MHFNKQAVKAVIAFVEAKKDCVIWKLNFNAEEPPRSPLQPYFSGSLSNQDLLQSMVFL